MTTKRNEKKKSVVLKGKKAKKLHVGKKRSPALVPVPDGLAKLMELANLLPVQFRHPYWAIRNEEEREGSKFVRFEVDILNWEFGTESRISIYFRDLNKDVPDELRSNTPALLWLYLQGMLEELPLSLQAFVLNDEQGNEVEFEGKLGKWGIHLDLQSWRNLSIIRKGEDELERIVQEASERIDKCIKGETSGKSILEIPDFDCPEGLLERARHRLILVLGLQELFSYTIHPEKRNDLFFAQIYYKSDAARSHFYIDNKGKIKFTPPNIVRLLEGIEAARIRECPICFKFYWAGRKDMRCCSTQCASTLRMREYRKRYYVK